MNELNYSPVLFSIVSVLIVSVISLAGISVIIFNTKKLNRITLLLVSLAAGTLIGDTFIHIIPEIFEEGKFLSEAPYLIILGILVFFFLEKILHWHHCHTAEHDKHDDHVDPLAVNNLIADGLHNYIDGLVIGASYLVSFEIGIATTIAVILHEIPQEIGDFGILIHSGMSKLKALSFNFLTALISIVGVITALIVGEGSVEVSTLLLSFAGGGFVYIALGDLIPELKEEKNLKYSIFQFTIFCLGVFLMYLLTFLEV